MSKRRVTELQDVAALRREVESHPPSKRLVVRCGELKALFNELDGGNLTETLRGIAPTPITDEDCRVVFDALSPDADSKASRRLYRFVSIARSIADLAWPDDSEVAVTTDDWMDQVDEGYNEKGPHTTYSTDGVWELVILRDGIHKGECGLKPRPNDKGRCAAAEGHGHPHVYMNEYWSLMSVRKVA